MRRTSDAWGIVGAVLLVLGAAALVGGIRAYQCRNAPDKLACYLSDRTVYVVPSGR